MNLLFINMTPIYHNTSALLRMCGFISGACKLGNTCDLLTLAAEEEDYSYDSTNEKFVEEYINHYYTFVRKQSYNRLRQSKAGSEKKNAIRDVLRRIYRSVNIYDTQVINVSGIQSVQVQFNKYDRIISISDPKSSHKLVEELVLQNKIENISDKWIQCWGDPWFKDSGNKYALVRRKVFREEEHYLDMAKRIVYTSPFTLEEQSRLFGKNADKMIYVNQSVIPLMNSPKDDSDDRSEIEEPVIGYFGSYDSRARNILPLYEACNRGKHRLKIVGGSDICLESTDHVEIAKKQPLSVVAKMEQKADILVCICNRSGTQIPGKIYYSAGYQKPIILIVDGEKSGEMRAFFESFHRYIICDNDIESIQQAIKKAKREMSENRVYKLDERYTDTYAAKVLLGADH